MQFQQNPPKMFSQHGLRHTAPVVNVTSSVAAMKPSLSPTALLITIASRRTPSFPKRLLNRAISASNLSSSPSANSSSNSLPNSADSSPSVNWAEVGVPSYLQSTIDHNRCPDGLSPLSGSGSASSNGSVSSVDDITPPANVVNALDGSAAARAARWRAENAPESYGSDTNGCQAASESGSYASAAHSGDDKRSSSHRGSDYRTSSSSPLAGESSSDSSSFGSLGSHAEFSSAADVGHGSASASHSRRASSHSRSLSYSATSSDDEESMDAGEVLWQTIRREASRDAESEPMLSSFLFASVLSHDSFARALAFVLANRVADSSLLSTQMFELFYELLSRDEDLRCASLADIAACRERDPACASCSQALLYFKGYHALQIHRIAHSLWVRGQKVLALALQSRMSEVCAVDIHPAARIGKGVLLDHGTGIVIGETAIIGNNVSILQNVTLGGTGKEVGDRHPKVSDNVLIGASATVLGNIRVGKGAQVAAGSLVLKPVPPHTLVAGSPAKIIGKVVGNPAQSMEHHRDGLMTDTDTDAGTTSSSAFASNRSHGVSSSSASSASSREAPGSRSGSSKGGLPCSEGNDVAGVDGVNRGAAARGESHGNIMTIGNGNGNGNGYGSNGSASNDIRSEQGPRAQGYRTGSARASGGGRSGGGASSSSYKEHWLPPTERRAIKALLQECGCGPLASKKSRGAKARGSSLRDREREREVKERAAVGESQGEEKEKGGKEATTATAVVIKKRMGSKAGADAEYMI